MCKFILLYLYIYTLHVIMLYSISDVFYYFFFPRFSNEIVRRGVEGVSHTHTQNKPPLNHSDLLSNTAIVNPCKWWVPSRITCSLIIIFSAFPLRQKSSYAPVRVSYLFFSLARRYNEPDVFRRRFRKIKTRFGPRVISVIILCSDKITRRNTRPDLALCWPSRLLHYII